MSTYLPTDSLREMVFSSTKVKDDIWMHRNREHYEYIASYIDDSCIVAKDPSEIINKLEEEHHYKVKGTGPITYHLGCDYCIDDKENMAYVPKKHIVKLIIDYTNMFGNKPRHYSLPLYCGNHLESDTSEELNAKDIKLRFDICTAVKTLSSFRASPRIGFTATLQSLITPRYI